MEPVLQVGVDGSISCWHRVNGDKIEGSELTGVSASVFSSSGVELVASTGITPTVDGEMAMAVSGSVIADVSEWNRATFSFTHAGVAHSKLVYFHVAHGGFEIEYWWEDLLRRSPDLEHKGPEGDSKFAGARQAAKDELYSRLINDGHKPWLIRNLGAMSSAFSALWLHYCLMQMSTRVGSDAHELAVEYREEFQVAYGGLNLLSTEEVDVHEIEPQEIRRVRHARTS